MDLGGKHGIWAMEITRSTVPKISKGFYASINDVKPSNAFIVYAGSERYPKGKGIEAIGLTALCAELHELAMNQYMVGLAGRFSTQNIRDSARMMFSRNIEDI